ncbi:MAG: hypothetical protein HY908_32760 [Myxococcales bacterium]|nr:hypothetical protein [Myxococcales bacterium]
MKRQVSVLLAAVVAAAVGVIGCGGEGGAGATSGSGSARATASQKASATPGAAPSATATTTATATAAAAQAWEELEALLKKSFEGVNTAKAADVDAAIAKFKEAAGAPDRTDGKKDFWYRKDKGGTCMEAWTLAGGGFGSSGSDKKNCK